MKNENKKYLFAGILVFGIIRALHVTAIDSIPVIDTNSVTIIFAGDIMGHDAQIEGAYDSSSQSYNYEPTFRYISDYIADADIAIGNLEVTLAGPPYKGYPQFSSPDELVVEAKNAGFDILVNANNHALDGGVKGFRRTLDILDSLGFYHAGTYRDSIEQASIHPLILEKNSIRIALLNYTYGTNGLKIDHPYQINRIDTNKIANDLEKAKYAKPDFIIVFIHWGNEYERLENEDQKALAEFILLKGADAIIGSHPHVVQPIKFIHIPGDTLNAHPVVYSLGNFVSNQRAQYKDGGILAELHISKIGQTTRLDSLNYLPYWVWRIDRIDGRSTFYVLPVARYELTPEAYDLLPGDIYRLKRFAADTRTQLKNIHESDYYRKKKE
jgi:poly-gamma-glutamate synthesis protein (capsule biosynthesis protein)